MYRNNFLKWLVINIYVFSAQWLVYKMSIIKQFFNYYWTKLLLMNGIYWFGKTTIVKLRNPLQIILHSIIVWNENKCP